MVGFLQKTDRVASSPVQLVTGSFENALRFGLWSGSTFIAEPQPLALFVDRDRNAARKYRNDNKYDYFHVSNMQMLASTFKQGAPRC